MCDHAANRGADRFRLLSPKQMRCVGRSVPYISGQIVPLAHVLLPCVFSQRVHQRQTLTNASESEKRHDASMTDCPQCSTLVDFFVAVTVACVAAKPTGYHLPRDVPRLCSRVSARGLPWYPTVKPHGKTHGETLPTQHSGLIDITFHFF